MNQLKPLRENLVEYECRTFKKIMNIIVFKKSIIKKNISKKH